MSIIEIKHKNGTTAVVSNISTKKNRACCRSVQHIKQTEQGALHLFLTYQSMSNIINEPINVSIKLMMSRL